MRVILRMGYISIIDVACGDLILIGSSQPGIGGQAGASATHPDLRTKFPWRSRLNHAAEALVGGSRRRLEPGNEATLRHRTGRKELIEVLHAALPVKLLIQRIVQLAHVDGDIFVFGVVLLQRAHGFTVVLVELEPFPLRGLDGKLARPVGRRVREPGILSRLTFGFLDRI